MKVVVNYKGNITEFRDVYAVIDNTPDTITIDFWKHNSIELDKSKIDGMDIMI